MCGILGLVAPSGPRPPLRELDLLVHRGPDSEGRVEDGPLTMGMRRLAIIDLVTGDQPLANEAGDVVCIVNGELYNHVELRAELEARGHVFTSHSDVSVVPHLYEELGDAFLDRLRGMFALALWDRRRGRLLLARDRFGIKPLYIAETASGLAFGSEVRPLVALGASTEPDLQAIADYLTFGYVPGTATGIRGVRALEPGSLLTWEDGRMEERRWWRLDPTPPADDVESILRESVRLHLRADVPLAVLLSGGLDSSLIAAYAADELPGLHTFTVGFGEPQFDELAPARAVAEALGTEHHEVHVRADAAADLPEILRRLDEPLADPSAIPLYYVCRAAAAEVKVALAGEGGDEVFGGYTRYGWDPVAARVGRLLPAGRLAAALETLPVVRGRAGRSARKDVVRRAVKLLRHAELPDVERYLAWFQLFGDDAKAAVLVDGASVEPAARVFARHTADAPSMLTGLGSRQYVDLNTMLASDLLLKADRMSMAHSLELRVPLLDHEVVRAGLTLPDAEKVRRFETKRVLRRLVGARLPAAIAARPKQGFEVPIDRWLRQDFAELVGDVLAPARVRARGLLDPSQVARIVDEHRSGARDHGLRLYSLLALELWLDSL